MLNPCQWRNGALLTPHLTSWVAASRCADAAPETPLPNPLPTAIFCPFATQHSSPLRILVAITGASGSLYAQRLLDNLDPTQHQVHVVLSQYAPAVIAEELPERPAAAGGRHFAQSAGA